MINQQLVLELDKLSDPAQLLGEVFKRFPGRAGIATSGQPTDTALIALAIQGGAVKPRVYTTDTLRLFPETYTYFDTLEKHFGFPIERIAPPAKELDSMVNKHGEFLFFDSKDKQEYCCYVRKVLPNLQALNTLDAWVTGLRRDQSASRASLPRVEIIEHTQDGKKRPILKVNALADWTEAKIAAWLKEKGIPTHPLFEKKLPGGFYYESLGCVICTTPVAPHEEKRAGRWRWFNALADKKECGLHLPVPPQ